MGVHDGHRDRKKAQYRRCGSEPFADHELLELLLFYAIPRVDTNPAAHALLDRFGSLQAVFAASVDELAKVPHIGPNAALLISLIPALYRRAMVSAANSEFVLDTRARMGEYFRELLSAEPKEVMYQLCLDAKGRRRNIYRVGEGDVSSVSLNTRQIVENAINSKAAMVALAHNHPSGVPFPSPEDREATLRIRDALEMIDVRLVEHVIVADNDYISMWESGMMGP